MPESFVVLIAHEFSQCFNSPSKFWETLRADLILRKETELESIGFEMPFHIATMFDMACIYETAKVGMFIEWIKIFFDPAWNRQ